MGGVKGTAVPAARRYVNLAQGLSLTLPTLAESKSHQPCPVLIFVLSCDRDFTPDRSPRCLGTYPACKAGNMPRICGTFAFPLAGFGCSAWASSSISVYAYKYIHIHICMRMCACIHNCYSILGTTTYVYTYIYQHICMLICVYIYTHTPVLHTHIRIQT